MSSHKSEPTCRLSLRVTTRSSKPRVEWDGSKALVWVASPPAEGQANEAVLRLLADRLGVPISHLSLVRGGHSREKVVEIAGIDFAQAIERLTD